jgi:hypothetical protein
MLWDFVFVAGKHGHMLMAGDEGTEDESSREEKGGDDHEMDEDESQRVRDLVW